MSLLDQLTNLNDAEIASLVDKMSDEESHRLLYDWYGVWARDAQQIPSGDWTFWMIMTGRGWGKTRTAAEFIRWNVENNLMGRVILVGGTASDVRDTMVEGESGIMAISPPWFYPIYEPSKRQLTWPNGAIAKCYSSEEPERLRGPQSDGFWADELRTWENPDKTWDNLMFGFRLGKNPRGVITTTPRLFALLKALMRRKTTHLTVGHTNENLLNLSDVYIEEVVRPYEGTLIGEQELAGKLLETSEGAIWSLSNIIPYRVGTDIPDLKRVAIGVDPQTNSRAPKAETGIVVAGMGVDGEIYVLGDYSLNAMPGDWGDRVCDAWIDFEADVITTEANQGGEMVKETVLTAAKDRGFLSRDAGEAEVALRMPVNLVYALKSKQARAEPVAGLYQKGLVHHVGTFTELEDEQTTWIPNIDKESPNRVDALVWAIWSLAFGKKSGGGVSGVITVMPERRGPRDPRGDEDGPTTSDDPAQPGDAARGKGVRASFTPTSRSVYATIFSRWSDRAALSTRDSDDARGRERDS